MELEPTFYALDNDSLSRDNASLEMQEVLETGMLPGLTFEDIFPYIMSVFAIVEYTLMAIMVVGNSFVLASFAIRRISGKNSHLSPSGRLVLNLAFADVLVGLGLIYFSTFKFWPEMAARLARYQLPCVLRFSICFLTMFGSHCALLVVALDRYTAIVHTLHYKDYMTTKVSWCMVLGGWLLPLAGAGAVFGINEWRPDVPSCDEHYIVPQFLLTLALPSNVFILVSIAFTHWRVHSEVKAYSRRCGNPDLTAWAGSRRHRHGTRRSAHVLLQVTGTFILCWTPLDVMLVLFVLVGPELWLLVLFECTFLLGMTSFLLNPMVYAWKTEATRKPIISLLVRIGLLKPVQRDGEGEGGRAVYAISGAQISVSIGNSSSGGSATSGASNQTNRTDVSQEVSLDVV